jgi:hypothetical protein
MYIMPYFIRKLSKKVLDFTITSMRVTSPTNLTFLDSRLEDTNEVYLNYDNNL